MSVHVSHGRSFHSLKTLYVENEYIRLVMLPELGAKIWEFTYKPKDLQLLWHNPHLTPTPVPFQATYVDYFCGGWDELFPNDMPEKINGQQEPDHGEIWSLPWDYQVEHVSPDEVLLYFRVNTVILNTVVEKWIVIKSGESKIRIRHKVTNTGEQEIPFLWKTHASFFVTDRTRIDLGAKTMYIEPFSRPRNDLPGQSYSWPYADGKDGQQYDMRYAMGPEAEVYELQYATQMASGWCALTHQDQEVGIGMSFDLDALPTCWVLTSFGGLNGYQTVMLEPSTGYPIYVGEGVKSGTHKILKKGESFDFSIMTVAYEGMDHVSGIDQNGNVSCNSD